MLDEGKVFCDLCSGTIVNGGINHIEWEFSQNVPYNDATEDVCDSCAILLCEAREEVELFVRTVKANQ